MSIFLGSIKYEMCLQRWGGESMDSITLLNRKNLVKIDINTENLLFKLKQVFIGKNND